MSRLCHVYITFVSCSCHVCVALVSRLCHVGVTVVSRWCHVCVMLAQFGVCPTTSYETSTHIDHAMSIG